MNSHENSQINQFKRAAKKVTDTITCNKVFIITDVWIIYSISFASSVHKQQAYLLRVTR